MANIKGIDCAVPLTVEKARAMAAAGMKFVCRYLVPATMEWKRLKRAEAEAITAAGMQVVSVFQRGNNDAAGGEANGTRDGKAALQEAKQIGQPNGTAIYFAVDYDAQPNDYAVIDAYLRAAAKELPGYSVGVYGSYAVIEEMAKRGACKHFWQTYAWSRGKLSKAANLYQYKNGQTLAGHTVDYNESMGGEGWWNANPQVVEKPVNKQADQQTKEALKVLQTESVIQSPEYWIQNAYEGGSIRGDYAALLIQNVAKKLTASNPVPEQPNPDPQPEPEPEKPARQPKPWSEIEKSTKAASVHVDIGFGGTGVLLKGGLLLTAKHVSKGRASFKAKTHSRDWLDATLVAEHPGTGKEAVDLALYKIERPPAKLPFLSLSGDPLVSGQKLLTVEAEYNDWIVRTGELCQVSAKMEPWEFDCSIPVENGNSGGAAVNEFGEVVGIFVNITSVGIQRGSVRESVPGGEAVNLQHPSVSEWLKKYL